MDHSYIPYTFISLIIIVLIIIYRKLFSNIRKERNLQKKYCQLYSLENKIIKGEIEFFFKCPSNIFIDFEILDSSYKSIFTIASKEFSRGSHILRFDSNKLTNGKYYYQLKTENQKTSKVMNVEN